MATKTTTTFIDDFDNSELDPDVKSTTFALNGATYEIDLSEKNAAALAAALEPFIAKARPVRSTRASSKGGPKRASSNAARLGKIRDWAASNGHAVSSRGRIPAVVVEAYEEATGDRG